ncbi:hypothetical protein GQ53DRAFT_821837 [Thozetella sp. PMI_491]|nr:hypothetical protein GQ53DRAFT_821837 [Thozetella sp. PMI_491]
MAAASNSEALTTESDELLSACTPQPPTAEPPSTDDTILALQNEARILRPSPFWAHESFSSIEDHYDIASWPTPVMENAFPLRHSQNTFATTVQAVPPPRSPLEDPIAPAAFQFAQRPGHIYALDDFALSPFASMHLAEAPFYAYNSQNSPMPLTHSSSSSRPTISLENPDAETPKRKRGRPYKSYPSTIETRSRPGRPPKNPPFETAASSSRPTNHRRRSSLSTSGSKSTGSIDLTRDRLARNRTAATKCREKAQAAAARLEIEEQEARETNHRLSASRMELQNQVLALRTSRENNIPRNVKLKRRSRDCGLHAIQDGDQRQF